MYVSIDLSNAAVRFDAKQSINENVSESIQ